MPPPVHKAVVLAGGLGTRMQATAPGTALTRAQSAAAEQGLKAMVPVGRPFLDYSLAALADAGLPDICLVTGPAHAAAREYYDRQRLERVRIVHAIQDAPRGTADAVLAAATFAGDDEFVVINSDNLYPVSALAALRRLDGPALVAFSLIGLRASGIPDERIARFPRVEAAADGTLLRLIEPPRESTLPAASMNCWRFAPAIFEACRAISSSPRGELELPHAVEYSIARGGRYQVLWSDEPVLDLSTRGDIEPVARRLAGREVRL